MTMKLDHDDLDRLIEKISSSDIQEFSLEGEDFKLEIKRNLFDKDHSKNNLITNNSLEKQISASKSVSADEITPKSNAEASQISPLGRSDLTDVTSPMVGTFYRAAAPGEAPFIELGSTIGVGQTICIIEAMKLMNEIESEFDLSLIHI